MPNESALPPPDQTLSLAQLARILGVSPVRLQRRARAGLLDAELVGKTYISTLRRLADSWDRRGSRGPAPPPLPDEVILHVHRHAQRRSEASP
jgi:hypothetical protein